MPTGQPLTSLPADRDMFLNDSQPAYRTPFSVRWFQGVMQRQFYATGREHAILKTPGAVLYFHKMRAAFPSTIPFSLPPYDSQGY